MTQKQGGSAGAPASKTSAAPSEQVIDEEGFEDKPMTFWEHLDELRKRVVWSVVAFFAACFGAWEIREWMLGVLVKPFAEAWKAQNLTNAPSLHFGAPGAAFMAYLKLTMIGGAALAAPMIFYQLWAFIAPGLYAREKKFVIPFVFFSTLLFVGGGYFGWRLAFPITFNYFLSMSGTVGEQAVTITPTIMMNEYLDFCAQLLLAFGMIFEIPLLVFFLAVAGIVNYLHMIRFGRWFVLVAFIVAAIVTPPDATSQVIMAVPMCILYALSIGVAWIFGKPPTEAQREAYKKAREKKAAA